MNLKLKIENLKVSQIWFKHMIRTYKLLHMKEFPSYFVPDFSHKFAKYSYERNLSSLRKAIYELVIKGDKTKYFDIKQFCNNHDIAKKDSEKLVSTIISELTALGWTVTTSYGGTGIFVYSGEMPVNCYPDGF